MKFQDRMDAGKQLADTLQIRDPDNTVVLALPRGGIPLAIEIAEKFHLPLDMLLSKKIGHPSHSEFAVGAISENAEPILDESITDRLDSDWIEDEIKRLRKKMASRREQYAHIQEKRSIKDKTVIIVDDGIATGLTMKAAIRAAKEEKAGGIIIAVPVIPEDTYKELKTLADEVVAVEVPAFFLGAVGAYYNHFPQVEDEEVMEMLTHFHSNEC